MVILDGRQPKYSNGMLLSELALLMKSLGAKTALNLDGGGSTTQISLDPLMINNGKNATVLQAVTKDPSLILG